MAREFEEAVAMLRGRELHDVIQGVAGDEAAHCEAEERHRAPEAETSHPGQSSEGAR